MKNEETNVGASGQSGSKESCCSSGGCGSGCRCAKLIGAVLIFLVGALAGYFLGKCNKGMACATPCAISKPCPHAMGAMPEGHPPVK